MRKLKLQVQVSIDGFIAGLNGELDWMLWDWSEDIKKHVWELTAPVDLILLGRKLAGGFTDAWTARANDPETAEQFAFKMVETRKIVFSRTIDKIDAKNTEVCGGSLKDEVTALKKQPGGDLIAYGGGSFVSSLIEYNLIDEYHLFVNPVAVGKGMTIFGDLREKMNLRLIGAERFECGIVDLCYEST